MDLSEFVAALEQGGELIYASPRLRVLEAMEEAEAVRGLERLDERRRLEMAGTPPPLNREQAIWAAKKLYRIGQFLVFRELPAEAITMELQDDCPGPDDAVRQYSVDLTFCWLPELHERAMAVASDDALTQALERLGAGYPFSFVCRGSASRFETMWQDESLRSLFVDRVIARKAHACLQDERIESAVRDALGVRAEAESWLQQ